MAGRRALMATFRSLSRAEIAGLEPVRVDVVRVNGRLRPAAPVVVPSAPTTDQPPRWPSHRLVLVLDEAVALGRRAVAAVVVLRRAGARILDDDGLCVLVVEGGALVDRPWAQEAWRILCDEATVARLFAESPVRVRRGYLEAYASPFRTGGRR